MLRRVGTLTTDAAGSAQRMSRLEPDTEYVVCRDQPVPAARPMESREAIVGWIDGCILGDLRTLILGIERFFEEPVVPRPLGGANFLLAAGCCMALEYFAQVYGKADDATTAVRRYVEDFLRQVDQRYLEIFGVVWSSFRNGIVHGAWPQAIGIQGRSERIAVGANPRLEGDHLAPASDYAGESIVISARRFFVDIEASFDRGFRDWILNESDEGVLVRAAPRLLEIRQGDGGRVREFDIIRGWNAARRKA